MKTQKSIIAALLLGLVFTLSGYANESNATSEAEYDLKQYISHVFRQTPWEDIVSPDGCCTVILKFRVNEDLTLDDIQVEGENEDLVHYAHVVLTRSKIKADKLLEGNSYRLQIRFQNQG
jgi:hypothetical protein